MGSPDPHHQLLAGRRRNDRGRHPMIIIRIHRSPTLWPKRPQRWYWTAKSPNGKTLARSEMYVNRNDCLHNAWLLFGDNNNITIAP